MPKKNLTIEFKRECAELVILHGYRQDDAAKAMSVSISSIQRWVSQCRKEQKGVTPKASALTPEQRQQIAVTLNNMGRSVVQICRCLSIAASSFYYRAKPESICAEKVKLDAAMKQIHTDMDATYGKVRMHRELQGMGFDIGLHKVRTSMKRLGLVTKRPKQHKYPSGGKASVIAPNRLNR